MNKHFSVIASALLITGLSGCNVLRGESTPSQYVDDVALTTKIKADLVASDNVDALDVNVDVKNGRVTLSGYASNSAERARAVRVARGVDGVKSVNNRIEVKKN
jgi:osmotically-inducible protein OsmY